MYLLNDIKHLKSTKHEDDSLKQSFKVVFTRKWRSSTGRYTTRCNVNLRVISAKISLDS